MDININYTNVKIMKAYIVNDKDRLASDVMEYGNDKIEFSIHNLANEPLFTVIIRKHGKDISVNSLDFADSNLYHVDTPALQHGMNMIKGFFSSNAYRRYAIKRASRSKRGKLISKKRKLNKEISKIDKQLGNDAPLF